MLRLRSSCQGHVLCRFFQLILNTAPACLTACAPARLQLGAAPWINVHHLASDGYVTSMAQMLKAQLRPDLKIYVEHSNEVWNAGR